MAFEKNICCSFCGKAYPFGKRIFLCGCGGSLEIGYDYGRMKREITLGKLRKREFSHSRYLEFFPVKKLVSMGEGGTPLIRSRNIETVLRLPFRLYFKFEGMNPTGSFKDRGSSVEIAKAVELGKRRIACASTGNMGASLSAYAGLAGIECYIFTPRDARHTKLEQILAYGAKLYKVSGDYAQAIRMVEHANRKLGVFLAGDYLYRREGTKSMGFEICEQMGMDMKDSYIFTPIGNAILISGLWKSFREFGELGFIGPLPKIAGIQAETCSPVVRAFRKKESIREIRNPKTVASSIECGNPLDGRRALLAASQSKGFMESVTDSEILKARDLLARHEGIFAEPAGAASFAGVLKTRSRIRKGSKVVCIVTGHGLKSLHTAVRGHEKKIKADMNVMGRIFR